MSRHVPHALTASITLIALFATPAMDCEMGGPIGNPNNNTSGDTVTLTITARSSVAGFYPGAIFGLIDDFSITRADMPAHLNENAPLVGIRPDLQENTVEFEIERGKVVTLIATEFGRANFNVAASDGSSVTQNGQPGDTYFVAFTGDITNLVEDGVVTVQMDGDRAITADYAPMNGILVKYGGCSHFKIEYTGPGYLGFGTLDDNSGGGPNHTISKSDDEIKIATYVYGKPGTTYTFTDLNGPSPNDHTTGFIRWEGPRVTGQICMADVPQAGSNAPEATCINYYLTSDTSITGWGCGSDVNEDRISPG